MKKAILIAIALMFVCICVKAQYSVTGRVIDANEKSPIPYAGAVLLRADSSIVKGITTDSDGRFVLENVAAGDYMLRVEILCYETEYRSVNVPAQSNLGEIILAQSVTQIDEVTITAEGRGRVEANSGYGTTIARDMIDPGTVVQYTPVEVRRYIDLVDLVRATVPGVRIDVNYDRLGGIGTATIVLTGAPSSMTGDPSAPLIIVDGIEVLGNSGTSSGAFQMANEMIKPHMVKSITVLRTGTMYGARGGNGAVIITTFTAQELLDNR